MPDDAGTISIITPTYNAVEHLGQCIDSVVRQTVAAEHIVIDGSSSDGTQELIRRHQGHLAVTISEPDDGLYHAINKGLEFATGDVIGVLNADDFYPDEDVLATVLETLTARPECDASYGNLVYVDRADPGRVRRVWRAGPFDPARFRWGWMPPHPTFFVRRDVYDRFGMFDTTLGSSADYELMLRLLLAKGVRAAYIDRILVHMRTGGTSNRSLGGRLTANRMDRRAWRANEVVPYPWTSIAKPLRKLPQWLEALWHPTSSEVDS